MNYRTLYHKFWYFLWFIALPLTISWITVDTLARMNVVDEFEPWYVLLLFAVVVAGIYGARARLPFWRDRDFDSAYNRSQRIKSAQAAIHRITKLVTRHKDRIGATHVTTLRNAISQLRVAIDESDHAAVVMHTKSLLALAEKHLAFTKKSAGREYFESIGVAILIALLLRLFAVEAFKIPSESMVPTLMVGDHIFVSKYQYGLTIPFTHKKFISLGLPDYGDVIVFAKPSRAEQGIGVGYGNDQLVGTDFIKRVVGLPGDTIEVKKSVVYVNGKPLNRCKVGRRTFKSKDPLTGEWVSRTGDLWVEQHGALHYTIMEDYLFDDFPKFTVPKGQIFVLGDNRDRSSDSRMWGTVPIDNIRGRAMLIWWSNRRPHGFAWDRVGTLIMSEPTLTKSQQRRLAKCEAKWTKTQ